MVWPVYQLLIRASAHPNASPHDPIAREYDDRAIRAAQRAGRQLRDELIHSAARRVRRLAITGTPARAIQQDDGNAQTHVAVHPAHHRSHPGEPLVRRLLRNLSGRRWNDNGETRKRDREARASAYYERCATCSMQNRYRGSITFRPSPVKAREIFGTLLM